MKSMGIALLITILAVNLSAQEGIYRKAFFSGERYKFSDANKDVNALFKIPFFEDSPFFVEEDWKDGRGPLGYGQPGIQTQASFGSDPNNKTITTYWMTDELRFEYDGKDFDSLFLRVRYDDGFVAYLNGVEIARRNLWPVSTHRSTAIADRDEAGYELIDVTLFKNLVLTIGGFFSAEIHQSSPSSADMVFDVELIYFKSNKPALINSVTRQPYLQMGSPSSFEVCWQTANKRPTELRYGTSALNLDQVFIDTNQVTEHRVSLTNLQPATRYYYSIENEPTFINDVSNQYAQTSPLPGTEGPYRFWVLGDFGDGSPNQINVYRDYLTRGRDKHTDGWLFLGDNVYSDGTQGEYQTKFFSIYPLITRNTMIYPSPGNHDLGVADAINGLGPYFENFDVFTQGEAGGEPSGTEAYYSYDFGNIHFISLESTQNPRHTTGKMARWLKADLQKNQQKWTIAYWHHPPYSKGSHDSDKEGNLIQMREFIVPILEQYGVDLVMTGHSHTYERSFLIDGHYDFSSTLADSMLLEGTKDGIEGSDGAYSKPTERYSRKGAVYLVNGTGGSLSTGEELGHPIMHKSIEEGGSVLLEINGDTLRCRFLNATTLFNDDEFTIIKNKSVACDTNLNLGDDLVIQQGEVRTIAAPLTYLRYAWNTGSTDHQIAVNQPGKYILEAYRSPSCKATDTIEVVQLSTPFIDLGADTVMCAGDTLILTAPAGFVRYLWSTGDTTAQIHIAQTGAYALLVTDALQQTTSDTVWVQFLEYPLGGFELSEPEIKEGDTVVLTAISPALQYQWDFGDLTSDTGKVVTHVYEIAGLYTIGLQSSNGPCATTSTRSLRVEGLTTGISILDKSKKPLVFPNPADQTVHLEMPIGASRDLLVRIFSQTGKLMIEKRLSTQADGVIRESFDVDSWNSGVYEIQLEGVPTSARFVVR